MIDSYFRIVFDEIKRIFAYSFLLFVLFRVLIFSITHTTLQYSTDYPFNYAESPYMMSSGTGMTIIPQRQFYTQLPVPFSECNVLEDNELHDERILPDRELFEAVCSFVHNLYYNVDS